MRKIKPGDKVKILDKTKGIYNLSSIEQRLSMKIRNTVHIVDEVLYERNRIIIRFKNLNLMNYNAMAHFGLDDLELIEPDFLTEEEFMI